MPGVARFSCGARQCRLGFEVSFFNSEQRFTFYLDLFFDLYD